MEHHFLRLARVFRSAPMDFVASRADERNLAGATWDGKI